MTTRSRWSGVILALIAAPLLYALAFGPACWISERWNVATAAVSKVYYPIFWLANHSPRADQHLKTYAQWGASPGAEADFRDNQLSWWITTFGSGTIREFELEIRCVFPANETPASESPPAETATERTELADKEAATWEKSK